jgi:hypothetical protein
MSNASGEDRLRWAIVEYVNSLMKQHGINPDQVESLVCVWVLLKWFWS